MGYCAKTLAAVALAVLFGSAALAAPTGVRKRVPRPEEYGNVVINNASEANGVAPVVFKHWLHRARYTCRLCHVDLGFAMDAGGTGVTEEDNRNGLYCGACHDGKTAFPPERRKMLLGKKVKNCGRCHSLGKPDPKATNFREFVKKFPRARFGNKVDWLKAEDAGLVKLGDEIEGISIKRRALEIPEDEEIQARSEGMPNIIFSHKKHAVWNGCELCHPQIFGVKRGSTVYQMQDIFDGKYCGACHGKVAFTNQDCRLCHSKDVY